MNVVFNYGHGKSSSRSKDNRMQYFLLTLSAKEGQYGTYHLWRERQRQDQSTS